MSHGKTLPVSYSRNTVVSILSWLFAFQSCAEHMHHFARCLVTSYLRKLFSLQFAWVFTLSLSHKQPLQLNPTINTGYKRLNKITNKFGIELKPTKQIVVNYNFTILMYVLSPIFTYVVFFSLYTHVSYYLYTIYYFCFTLRCLDEFCLKCFRNTGCQSLLVINFLLAKRFKSLC